MPLMSPGSCLATLLSLGLLHGCGGDSGPTGPSGPGGSGGTGAVTGGQGGSSLTGGNGGSSATGGAAGGGAAGSGGSGGLPDAGPSTADPTAALDACFAGLRTLATFNNQIATKRSADGSYAIRLALEYPPGYVGTSGTVPWLAVRFAIVTPQGQLCLQDEKTLRDAYKGSLHNCNDVLTVASNGRNYKLEHPDTTPEHPVTTLSITGAAAVPPLTLTTVSCQKQSGGQCLSGGPCQ